MSRGALATICIGFLVLTACGGGGGGDGGDGPRETGITLSGVVEDGPVAGARVTLRDRQTGETLLLCGASGVGRCETVTAADGTFSLRLRSGTPLEGLEIHALGGLDRETGMEFARIPLRAPVELFQGAETALAVSPVTSLVAGRLQAGATLASAVDQVCDWLGLPAGSDPGAPPTTDALILQRSLLLASLALELQDLGETDPLQQAGSQADGGQPLIGPDGLDPAVVLQLGLNAAAAERLAEMQRALAGPAGSLPAVFKKIVITQGLRETARQMLIEESGFDPEDPAVLRNLETLAERILQASGETVIPLGGVVPPRIARYVFFTYGLDSPEPLAADPVSFAAGLVDRETGAPLETDPRIAELAALKTLYSVAVPLLDPEIPGTDNRKRLEYFYNSDLSPFYLAEEVGAGIHDDFFGDEVMLAVAVGKAEAGLLAEAETILATQVFQAEKKSEGYHQFASVLISFGHYGEAIAALHKAEENIRRVIEAKGYANLASRDVTQLHNIGSAFRRAGDLESALAIYDYLTGMAPYFSTPTLFGFVIAGTWRVADEYLAAGRPELAEPLVDFMLEFALQTPPNPTGSTFAYKARVFYLLETAKRYVELGRHDQARTIYQTVQAIRAADGYQNLTASQTWIYMVDFVELLYRIGDPAEAFALASQIPASYANKAFKLVATYTALEEGYPAALAIVEARLTLPADRIEALTYFANNLGAEYIALALIRGWQEGGAPEWYLEAARQALEEALRQVALLAPATDADRYKDLVQRGYVKIAGLYRLAGDPQTAESLLNQVIQEILPTIGGLKYRVDTMTELALEYDQLGKSFEVETLLDWADDNIRGVLATTMRPADPNAAGTLYSDLATVWDRLADTALKVNRRSRAAEAAQGMAATAQEIFDAVYAGQYTGDNRDRLAGKEVDGLIKAADYLTKAGLPADAAAPLAAAEAVALQISVEAKRIEKFIDEDKACIIGGYAEAGHLERALALARELPYAADRYLALQAVATVLAGRNDFPNSPVARIDQDGDGRPDFFHPLATVQEILDSGLELDLDCDGDGIPDAEDRRPWFLDSAGW